MALPTDEQLEELARREYSRLLWRNPKNRHRLLYMWEHPKHPDRERFKAERRFIVSLMECADPKSFAASLPEKSWSIQALSRHVPVTIWNLWDESKDFPMLTDDME